ncbi:CapA family protein [Desulfolucanica intricata]|uniref:CapA family protein n=1 Tax=Desulfolucanica intricata TaxID=1285191 RepID=UPI000831FEB2|nr:CapA family protein [Desulfolucanica intricata]
MKILIAGDLVPTKSNIDLFNRADINALLGEKLVLLWNSADIRLFNLEVPLTNQEKPIDKCGPNLIAPTSTVKGIKALNPSLLVLANNHILDQGEQGLYSTTKVLEENNIDYVGVGSDINKAAQPYILERDGIRVGFYACAEHEFTIATEQSPGANPFDPLESLDHIHDLANKCDYLIVLYHGGKEHYRYPSPGLQKVCRKMVNKGADLVVCQHSHCIGAFEKYNGGTIVYGQGNFLFDHSESEFWQTSLLLNVTVTNESMLLEYIPIVKQGYGVRLASKQQAEEILHGFEERSRQILDETFVQQEYSKFAAQMLNGYLTAFHGNNLFFRVFNKLCRHKLATKLYTDKSLTVIQNFIECEAHRELVLAGLKSYRK